MVQKCDLGKAEARSDRNLVTLDSAVGRLPIEGTVSLNSRYHGDEVERAEALTRAIESQVTPLKPEIKKITNQELFVSWLKLLVKKCDHPQFILVHN